MMRIAALAISVLALGVVACEGTIEVGENFEYQDVSTGAVVPGASSGKGDVIADPVPTGGNAGEALYQQFCASCHGADATGGPSWPGSIVGYADIAPIVTNGRGAMPPVAIGGSDIAAIQSWLTSLVPAQAPETTGATPALQFFSSNCAGCHGAEGEGSPNGPQIRFQDDLLARFAVRQGRNGPGIPSTMPTYSTTELPEDQLDEILDWLAAFPKPTTGEGLYNQFCSNCHGVDGLGGPSAEPVAGRLSIGEIVRTGHAPGRYAERREYMSAWTEEQITAQELTLIAQYVRSM